jgi:hypothetical protein
MTRGLYVTEWYIVECQLNILCKLALVYAPMFLLQSKISCYKVLLWVASLDVHTLPY